MSGLRLSFAIGDYDRIRPLMDGQVVVDGVDPVFMSLSPEEIFFRVFRNKEFDVCEMSLSSYLVKLSRGESDYVAVPVFPSRAFRHASIYVRKDRVRAPGDLKGKRIGIPEYQLTALVWARALLADSWNVQPEDVEWVSGGIDQPGRPEKIKLTLPPGVKLSAAPDGKTISGMLNDGEIDAFIAPRAPSGDAAKNPDIGWLFERPMEAARQYYEETGIFPIMHVLAVRKTLVEDYPWLPNTLVKAFEAAKAIAQKNLMDPAAPRVSIPFLEETMYQVRSLMGENFWPYGVEANRMVLEAFADHHYRQGLSARKVSVDELFHPSTFESFKI